ncbi:hypothetical protein PQC18_gp40 [Streptomyces phage Pablito]|uniref:Uncharacterized protein n=1 Tax=Streptomyces phage Pablito TaxID=2894593 RepID=A0AAE8YF73_9CAUD|nr:hypothetical protein PQC18_gp40 [Streptomyces phage Pablito]UFD97978.1 hypothetical protein [Streptomyces phage Pablito]
MADIETTETETGTGEAKPTGKRRAPRKPATPKPDPVARSLSDVQAAMKGLGEYSSTTGPDHRKRHHDGRAAAWAQQYAHEGTFDSLLLSNAFEAVACYDHEQRHALVQLAAIALAQVEKLDASK